MNALIGCDLGGTKVRAAVIDVDTGQSLSHASIPTLAREGHAAVMERMAALILDVIAAAGLAPEQVGGVGIGVPGVLDLEKGETLFLPNLAGTWPNVPLASTIAARTGLRVALINDVRAITYGEWRFGAGRGAGDGGSEDGGADTLAVFAVGTGIGGGLVINGRLHMGTGGTAGELGHMSIDYNGPRCGCGNYGCLEALASGPAISALGMKAVVQGLTTRIAALCENDLNRIDPALIARAAQEGDPIAQEIYEQAGLYLGVAAANVCVAINPQRIIVTGGVANAGRLLLDPMERTLRERVTVTPIHQVKIVPALLGSDAGVVGAALWAYERIGS